MKTKLSPLTIEQEKLLMSYNFALCFGKRFSVECNLTGPRFTGKPATMVLRGRKLKSFVKWLTEYDERTKR